MSKEAQEAYLKWADENLKARQTFFAALNVDKVASELTALSSKKKRERRTSEGDASTEKPVLEPRHSSRLLAKQQLQYRNDRPFYSPSSPSTPKNLWKEDDCSLATDSSRQVMDTIFSKCAFETNIQLSPFPAVDFTRVLSVSPVDVMPSSTGVSSYQQATSVSLHPSTSPILAAIGNKSGQIVFLVLNKDDGAESLQRRYQVHDREGVISTAFEPSSCHFLSAGDKTLRSLDLAQASTTNLLYKTMSDNAFLTSICVDFNHRDYCSLTGDLWLSQTDGTVVRIDSRLENCKPCGIYRVNTSTVNSLAFSKNDDWLFTASSDGTVAVWDVRNIPSSTRTYRRSAALATSQYDGDVMHLVSTNPTNPAMVLTETIDGDGNGGTVRILRFKDGLDHFNEVWSTKRVDFLSHPVWHPGGSVIAAGGRSTISLYKATSEKVTWKSSTASSSSSRQLFYHCAEVTHQPPGTSALMSTKQTYLAFHPVIAPLLLSATGNSVSIVKFES